MEMGRYKSGYPIRQVYAANNDMASMVTDYKETV